MLKNGRQTLTVKSIIHMISILFFVWISSVVCAYDRENSSDIFGKADVISRVKYGMVELPPVFFRGADGKFQGFFVDILEYISKREGWTMEYIVAPGDILMQMLANGEIDLLSMSPTPRLEEKFDFCSSPHYATWYTCFVRSGTLLYSFTDLNGKRVAMQRGFYGISELRKIISQLELSCMVIETNSTEEAFVKLVNGDVDICAAEQLPSISLVKKYDVRGTAVYFAPSRIFYGTTKGKNATLLKILDENIKSLVNDPASPYPLWQRRWFYDEGFIFFPEWAIWTFAGGFLVICVFGFGIVMLRKKEQLILRKNLEMESLIKYEKANSEFARLFLFKHHSLGVLNEICGRLLNVTGAARVLVYKNKPVPGHFSSILEAEAFDKNIKPIASSPLLKEIHLKSIPRKIVKTLGSGHVLRDAAKNIFGEVDILSPGAFTSSVVLAPIFEGKKWWGVLAVMEHEKSISKEVMMLLKTTVDIIGGFLLRKRAEDLLKKLAETDYLTGLPNRRAFFEFMERDIAEALRQGKNISLALLDIDFFKDINDRFGHDAGDTVLQEFAKLLLISCHSREILGRLGGEEFGVIFTEKDTWRPADIAERIRKNVEKAPFTVYDKKNRRQIFLSVSLGVAVLLGKDDTVAQLYRRADQALYCAKRRGRNRVEVWEESLDELVRRND